jgi:hypothetical protein
MNPICEKAITHLTGQRGLHSVSETVLEDMIAAYPYFSPAHVLLAARKYVQQQGSEQSLNNLGSSLVHVQNHAWLQVLLTQTGDLITEVGMPEEKAHDIHSRPALEIPSMEQVRDIIRSIDPRELPDNPADVDDTDLPEASLEDELQLPDERLSGLLSEQLADFKKPVSDTDPLPDVIAPVKLHTIDYFASQGIRIDLSQVTQDKLTSQLRKFTDWLKHMKQQSQQPTDLGTDAGLEQAAALIAENSNESREVVTETMAEVLTKQGQVDKAIQLYIKLSFINPEKSAYFAAKIQQLKGI